jgi:hypothetical protein
MGKKRLGKRGIYFALAAARNRIPGFPAFAEKPGLDNGAGNVYAPAESLWLLDCAIPYCRILYSSAL